jgi:hypothetical protein
MMSLMLGVALALKLGSDKEVREAAREKFNDLRDKFFPKQTN